MRASVIVAVYKDVEALHLVVEALKQQTYKNFEVVVAEDGQNEAMGKYVKSIQGLEIKHTTQEDVGVRKARSQNNAVLASSGEYLIFIDGDCIPYSTFVEGHVVLAERGKVLSGRRVNLPKKLSEMAKYEKISLAKIERNPLRFFHLFFDKEVRFKQGIRLNPGGLWYKILSKRNPCASILGCNFSCFKKDLLEINGFDESYGETAISDDVDLDWRFRAKGLELKSCKNIANIFHLWHQAHDRGDATKELLRMEARKSKGEYVCSNGLNLHCLKS